MPEYYSGVNPMWPYPAIYGPPPGPAWSAGAPADPRRAAHKREDDRSAWRCVCDLLKWSVVLVAAVLWAVVLVAVHQVPSLAAPVALGAFAAWRLRVWSGRRLMYQKARQ